MPRGIYIRTAELNRKMSEIHKGKPSGKKGKLLSGDIKEKISKSVRQVMTNPRIRQRMSELAKKRIGKLSNNWKGGITPMNHKIRNSIKYLNWRKIILERDNFTCQKCGQNGGKLHIHHINNFAEFPELRLRIDNGITMCKKCHREFHKIFGEKGNTKEQLENYLQGR